MIPLRIKGPHRIVTLQVPGKRAARILCMMQKDAAGGDAYYVMAENEGSPLKWRSMIQGNAVRRLRNEFKGNITEEAYVDEIDAEMILLCTMEASKA